MKAFSDGRSLRASSLALRTTLTGFLLFTALGYASNFALLAWKTGLSPDGIAHYYRGDEATMQFPKEMHELLENLHFHVYIVPMVLLVLTHVFFMTRWSPRAKLVVTLLAYGTALAEFAAPWLVRFVGAGFAWWKLASSVSYHATLVFLIATPLFEMWTGPVLPPSARESDVEVG